MGNCLEIKPGLGVLTYSHIANVLLRHKDKFGRLCSEEEFAFRLTSPTVASEVVVKLSAWLLRVSTCVLPGQHPKSGSPKACQDGVAVLVREDAMLACIFDGHGEHGQEVVEFCKSFTAVYFEANSAFFAEDAEGQISQLCEVCDWELSHHTEINCVKSGTTAVFVYIRDLRVSVGSVGDSRALLAYIPTSSRAVAQPSKRCSKYRRSVAPVQLLSVRQLTVDQKPDLPQESARILSRGGKVAQSRSKGGSRLGPFRVWKHGTGYPGLAMSRSIGDLVARQCGVIPTPIVTQCPLRPHFDQFLLVCTDGISDAFSNADVAYFVDTYRKAKHPCGIAELLCEEARYRWLEFLEEEESVTIDDISCVVVEFEPARPCSGPSDTESRWDCSSTTQDSSVPLEHQFRRSYSVDGQEATEESMCESARLSISGTSTGLEAGASFESR